MLPATVASTAFGTKESDKNDKNACDRAPTTKKTTTIWRQVYEREREVEKAREKEQANWPKMQTEVAERITTTEKTVTNSLKIHVFLSHNLCIFISAIDLQLNRWLDGPLFFPLVLLYSSWCYQLSQFGQSDRVVGCTFECSRPKNIS